MATKSNQERRWSVPSKRASGYANDRKAKVHTYGPNLGKELSDYWNSLKLLFQPETKAYKSLGGFITIGSIFPNQFNWLAFWNLTAFLSIILAVMNILPIPALDGGHVLFLLVEIITRRKPSDRFLEIAQTVGLVILLALLIVANGNDIIRWLF